MPISYTKFVGAARRRFSLSTKNLRGSHPPPCQVRARFVLLHIVLIFISMHLAKKKLFFRNTLANKSVKYRLVCMVSQLQHDDFHITSLHRVPH